MVSTFVGRRARRGAALLALASLGACTSMGGLGSVLGGVLGGQGNQVNGMVRGVDTRSRQIGIQQSNGQTFWVTYDNNTQVVYQNQNFPVTALENGDQVTANIQDNGNGSYYTNYVRVDQSVSGSTGGSQSGNVQSYQGSVAQVDRSNGWFTMDVPNYGRFTVFLPPNVSPTDVNRFNNLRPGDYVRVYGVPYTNGRVELRQFY